MKILVISTGPFGMDGITNVILNYYRATDKTAVHFDFVIPNEIGEAIRVEFEKNGSQIFQLTGRMKNPWLYTRKLTKLIKTQQYDIVHAHGNSCTLALETYAAKTAGVNVIIPHSHNSTNTYKWAHKGLRRLFDSTYTHGFACGELAGQWLYNKKPFEVINNAIHVEKFEYDSSIRERVRQSYGYGKERIVGHIGHFTYQKNHEFVLAVFKELHNIDNRYRLMLIGDGALRDAIEKKAQALGITQFILFTGNTLDVPDLMQAMDMLVLPSRFEGLPLTLVEAQAASLPCYVSDAVSKEAGITDLVKFFPLEKSPEQWAEFIHSQQVIDRQVTSKNIHTSIASAGYSISSNAERVTELYKQYVEQAATAR